VGDVVVVVGPGSIGQAIARRVGTGKHVLLADLHRENAEAASVVLSDAGFENSTTLADVSQRESVLALVEMALSLGEVGSSTPLGCPRRRLHRRRSCA
jgi:NAD(P)-dependent dehydrogenase (short-subunit alcohol dehydrogenase family)